MEEAQQQPLGAPQAAIDTAGMSLEEKMLHKNWSVRVEAYNEAMAAATSGGSLEWVGA